jgi:acyl-CoA reductase-like NAD-dependent aldehyde dehydrogenase
MATVEAVREVKQFVAGAWSDAADGSTFEDTDPYTGETVALVPAGGADDARAAIEAAAAARASRRSSMQSGPWRLTLATASVSPVAST